MLTRSGFNASLQETRDLLYPGDQRQPSGAMGLFISTVAVAIALFTLYMAFTIPMGAVETRALHLAAMISVTFLIYPTFSKRGGPNPSLLDITLAILAVVAFMWAFFSSDRFESRMAYYDPILPLDLICGTLAIILISEATRRTVGMSIVVLNAIFIIYAMTGSYWPGLLEHRGSSFPRMIEHLYMLSDGMFNFIMGITATFLFTFMMFGSFLLASRGDRIFNDLAVAIAGSRRGGPAKVAVISSAMMGMLSGSTVSNVATTGTMTIPLMKKTGFSPTEAAAIESTASLGGALAPPLMGAGVFLMVAFTGVPLQTILLYSIIPALLYFLSIYAYVDIKARRKNLMGLPKDSLPKFWHVIRDGGHIFIPIGVLVYLLVIGYTPFYASAACVVGVVIVGALRISTRMNLAQILVALEASTRVTITVSALSGSAAIIYGVITKTGLLVKVSSIILAMSGGSLLIGLLLIAFMSYILGMGLPVTASYVIIGALGAPALGDLGLPIFAAHLVIFWFSQDSTITPPICMTAFVAARIANAPPMMTGWEAVKIAKGLYIIPFVFAFGDLLSPDPVEVILDAIPLGCMFVVLPMIFEGYANRPLNVVERILLLIPVGAFFMGTVGTEGHGIVWTVGAALVTAAILFGPHLRPRRAPAE